MVFCSLKCYRSTRSQEIGYIYGMSASPKKISMVQVLICGAAIVTLSMGIRHGFGLWLQPITLLPLLYKI
jgi:hypothetical protein